MKFFFFENLLHKKRLKGGFQLMLILGLLGMYFDAVVVFVTKSSLLFKLTVAILWGVKTRIQNSYAGTMTDKRMSEPLVMMPWWRSMLP